MRVRVTNAEGRGVTARAVSTDDLIANKELFHEIGGELDTAFDDLGLKALPGPPHVRVCERCTCCH